MSEQVRNIVALFREAFSSLSLENVIDNLEGSIEELGINVLYSDMSDLETKPGEVSGFIRVNKNNGFPEMVINANENISRQRFTMAHELGHILMHWKWLPGEKLDNSLAEVTFRQQVEYRNSEIKKEREANEFAAELLLPLSEIKKIRREHLGESYSHLIEIVISKRYKVSPQVVQIQLNKSRQLDA